MAHTTSSQVLTIVKKTKNLRFVLQGNAWFQNKYMLSYKCIFKKTALLSCKYE
jgi:hypothetical protein